MFSNVSYSKEVNSQSKISKINPFRNFPLCIIDLSYLELKCVCTYFCYELCISTVFPQAYPHNEMVQYRALYSYTAQHYDELTFNEGDIINVSFDWLEISMVYLYVQLLRPYCYLCM